MLDAKSDGWGFYGREKELSELRGVLDRGRFFFLKISGRRRIGKRSLIREALRPEQRGSIVYIPIPDSDPAGVVSTAREFLESFRAPVPAPKDLRGLASCLAQLIRSGYVVALDEFQYFSRKTLYAFNSHLQAEVDRLAADAHRTRGGLIVLGSIHTEMSAI